MQRRLRVVGLLLCALGFCSCSPRDFLTRRLAFDLIAASPSFQAPQSLLLNTGVLSNKDYLSPDYLVLQRRGWISATTAACPVQLGPPPCWNVTLTPSGVDTVRILIPPGDVGKRSFVIPVVKRDLLAITGISKQGNVADVEFTWKWTPLNELGAALYAGDLHYKSNVAFRCFDDGWRVLTGGAHREQSLEDALKSAEPAQD
jgi:hypothetical protein